MTPYYFTQPQYIPISFLLLIDVNRKDADFNPLIPQHYNPLVVFVEACSQGVCLLS